eukprot:11818144-Alexandrium_andersonii.AAC.1
MSTVGAVAVLGHGDCEGVSCALYLPLLVSQMGVGHPTGSGAEHALWSSGCLQPRQASRQLQSACDWERV